MLRAIIDISKLSFSAVLFLAGMCEIIRVHPGLSVVSSPVMVNSTLELLTQVTEVTMELRLKLTRSQSGRKLA